MSELSKRKLSIDSQAVHAGARQLAPEFGINTPVITSSAFDYRADHVRYPRYHNSLNHDVVADRLAQLESAESGLVTASGMGAISAIFLALMKPGEHAIVLDGIYGGTTDLIDGLLKPLGFEFTIWDGQIDTLANLARPDTRLLYLESPTNPLLRVVDLAACASFSAKLGLISVIDNTFATPILQRPIESGFDLVMHSATKYLGGHSDMLCGALLGSKALIERIRPTAVRLGSSLNGQDLALLERSIKTLSVRVRRQSASAGKLAEQLHLHPGVQTVHYPGLKHHPGHEIASRQMEGFGAMLSFSLAPGRNAERFLDALQLVQPAISLGGVESTISQPSRTSHAKLDPDRQQALGITERLMRLSVGVEAPDDLWDDLKQALEA